MFFYLIFTLTHLGFGFLIFCSLFLSTIKVFPSLIKGSISSTIERLNWIMVKLLSNLQRDNYSFNWRYKVVTMQMHLLKWRHLTSCLPLMFYVYTYSCDDTGRWFLIFYSTSFFGANKKAFSKRAEIPQNLQQKHPEIKLLLYAQHQNKNKRT